MTEQTNQTVLFRGGVYDFFKRTAQFGLPAIATFYAAVAAIWNLPYSVEVVGTLTAANVLIAALVAVSKKQYYNTDIPYDGKFVVNTTDVDKDTVRIALDGDPLQVLTSQETVMLKVEDESKPSQ